MQISLIFSMQLHLPYLVKQVVAYLDLGEFSNFLQVRMLNQQ